MVVRKMKEKCKDAARMRREKERAEFVELSKLLPLPSSTTSQLDKASIIRLTSSYLRMRSAFPRGLGEDWGHKDLAKCLQKLSHQPSTTNIIGPQQYSTALDGECYHMQQQLQHQLNQVRELGSLLLQTLDGFVFALHRDGKIMYISETASVHLGLPQIDLTGSSVFEYVHPSDHNDIYAILGLSESDRSELELASLNSSLNSPSPHHPPPPPLHGTTNATSGHYELGRSFCMRMKCILPKRNAGLVNSGYKAIHCNGYLKVRSRLVAAGGPSSEAQQQHHLQSFQDRQNSSFTNEEWESYALVAVGHSLLPTASTEVKLTRNSFMFRANLDLKIYYIETPIVKLLGFEQIEMIGQSLYQFVHVNDTIGLESSHRLLLDKGQVVTKYYRLMRRDGGFVWVQSYATLVNNPRNMPKPQHIVSICFVLAENPHDQSGIFSQTQQTIRRRSQVSSSADCMLANSTNSSPNGCKTTKSAGSSGYESASSFRGGHRDASNGAGGAGDVCSQKRKEKYSAHRKLSKKIKASLSSAASPPMVTNSNGPTTNKQISTINLSYHLSGSTSRVSVCSGCRASQSQCSCMLISTQPPTIQTIGSLRRPSDDTCSIVSSVASTSICSSNASSHHAVDFLGAYNTGADHPSACYRQSPTSQDPNSIIPLLSGHTQNPLSVGQQNEDMRQLAMIEMMPPSSGTPYDLGGFDSIQRQTMDDGRQSLGGGHGPAADLGNHHQVWPITVVGRLTSDELQKQHHNNQIIIQAPQLEDELQMPDFNQQNSSCNISPQSLYLHSSTDWFVHDNHNHCFDHGGRMPLSQVATQSSLVYHHCIGEDEKLANYSSAHKSSHYHEAPPYMGTNNLAPMSHHQQQVIVNDNDRYTMFRGGSS